MVVKKAAATAGAGAGGFLGGLFNNPGVIILGALAIIILFFQGDIRRAFGSLGEGISQGIGGLGNIDITLPEFNFPDITFPDITLPSLFPEAPPSQFPDLPPGGLEGIPLEPGGVNPPEAPTAPTPIDVALSEGATPSDIADIIGIQPDDPNQAPGLFQPPTQELPPLAGSIAQIIDQLVPIPSPTTIPESQLNIGGFQGEAISAPLGALPLSQIIEMFNVTASQAANIQFIAQQGGDPFALPGNIFGENPPAVSDPAFAGLSPEEIALQLTGGNISDF